MEEPRWQRLLGKFIPSERESWRFLDIGAGTGFVGTMLKGSLDKADVLICTDISQTMLECCQQTLTHLLRCAIDCRKMKDERIPADDASIDVVTMNSVLHHVPDTQAFLQEIERILRPGGLLFIGHEPNARFSRSRFLQIQTRILHGLTPKRIAAAILKAFGLYGRIIAPGSNHICDRVNKILMTEKVIMEPLTPQELSSLIDVHSPTAGGMRLGQGFDPFTLLDTSPFEPLTIETYSHLGKESNRAGLKLYDRLMGRMLPTLGSSFFLVARKNR